MANILNKASKEEARAQQEQTNANSPFFEFPVELRNVIYAIDIPAAPRLLFFETGKRCPMIPSILHACRQLRKETIPIYYGQSRFYFPETFLRDHGTEWLQSLSADAISALRRLRLESTIKCWCGYRWHQGPDWGGEGKASSHFVMVMIDLNSLDGCRYSVRWRHDPNYHARGEIRCTALFDVQIRVLTVLERLKACNDEQGF